MKIVESTENFMVSESISGKIDQGCLDESSIKENLSEIFCHLKIREKGQTELISCLVSEISQDRNEKLRIKVRAPTRLVCHFISGHSVEELIVKLGESVLLSKMSKDPSRKNIQSFDAKIGTGEFHDLTLTILQSQ